MRVELSLGHVEDMGDDIWAHFTDHLKRMRLPQPLFCMCYGGYQRSRLANSQIESTSGLQLAQVPDDDYMFPLTSLDRFVQTGGAEFQQLHIGTLVVLCCLGNSSEVQLAKSAIAYANQWGIEIVIFDLTD